MYLLELPVQPPRTTKQRGEQRDGVGDKPQNHVFCTTFRYASSARGGDARRVRRVSRSLWGGGASICVPLFAWYLCLVPPLFVWFIFHSFLNRGSSQLRLPGPNPSVVFLRKLVFSNTHVLSLQTIKSKLKLSWLMPLAPANCCNEYPIAASITHGKWSFATFSYMLFPLISKGFREPTWCRAAHSS